MTNHEKEIFMDSTAYVPPSDWRKRIAIAKSARELGRKLREGKPGSFRPSVGPDRGYGSRWR